MNSNELPVNDLEDDETTGLAPRESEDITPPPENESHVDDQAVEQSATDLARTLFSNSQAGSSPQPENEPNNDDQAVEQSATDLARTLFSNSQALLTHVGQQVREQGASQAVTNLTNELPIDVSPQTKQTIKEVGAEAGKLIMGIAQGELERKWDQLVDVWRAISLVIAGVIFFFMALLSLLLGGGFSALLFWLLVSGAIYYFLNKVPAVLRGLLSESQLGIVFRMVGKLGGVGVIEKLTDLLD